MATNKDKEKEQEKEQTQQDTTGTTAPDPVEEAKKQAQAILDAAKAEAEAQAAAAKAQDQAHAEAQAEKVPVRLFKDNDRYKDDVFVAVNGRSFQIRRGEEVMVPRYVAEVLERSMSQDQATASLIDRQSGEYAAEAAKRGL